ncbi:hypothetical protein PVAP13_7NG024072 [Panicum virgatum]|uniref:Uncharacterized protein n=1 Tax=Panicum virgatum TaxID=38727 RepID=A0A8T0Q6Z2_PANVG|nr:hypothetical protein PVAP13_7NG024072 [Panicum virgatum]
MRRAVEAPPAARRRRGLLAPPPPPRPAAAQPQHRLHGDRRRVGPDEQAEASGAGAGAPGSRACRRWLHVLRLPPGRRTSRRRQRRIEVYSLVNRVHLHHKYVGTCNGVILLAPERFDGCGASIVLFNPAIAGSEEAVRMELPDLPEPNRYRVSGFGYGPSRRLHMVLVAREEECLDTNDRKSRRAMYRAKELLVYTLGAGGPSSPRRPAAAVGAAGARRQDQQQISLPRREGLPPRRLLQGARVRRRRRDRRDRRPARRALAGETATARQVEAHGGLRPPVRGDRHRR